MLRPYFEVLARPGAVAFSSAGVLARLPMSMVGIAIVLAVPEVYGSYGVAGSITAVYVIVHSIAAPVLAHLVDRFGQARVMTPALRVAFVGLTGIIIAIMLEAHLAWVFAGAVVSGASIGSVGALVRARWSYIVKDPAEVHTAYSLESALDEFVFIVGPVVATVLATSVAPTAGLWLPAVAVLVGGWLLLSQRQTEPPVVVRAPGSAGALFSVAMLVLSLVFAAVGAIFGGTDVATVAFAEEQGSKGSAGLVLAVFAAGSMISGFAYGLRHFTTPLWRRFVIGVGALAAGVSLFFVASSLVQLGAVMFVTGFTIAPTIVNGNALVTSFVRPDQLTTGLAWVGTALGVGVAIGASVGGIAIDNNGSHGGFLVVAGAAVFAVIATLVAIPALRRAAAQSAQARVDALAAPAA